MITIKDVTLPILEGQYWAWLNPLSLLRVVRVDEFFQFTVWQPGHDSEEGMIINGSLDDNFRLLRFSHAYSNENISRDLSTEFKAKTGDVFELEDKMLAFAVLENDEVALYTDERTSSLIDSLVQRGPGPSLERTVPTRYRRILNAHNPNLPLVRPMGRALLRPKEDDPVLLPLTNVRSENRVFSNLNYRHQGLTPEGDPSCSKVEEIESF